MIRRETARAIFETACQSASHTLSADKVEPSMAKKLQKQIDEAFAECKLANSALLDLSTRESAANEIKWLQASQAMYNEKHTSKHTSYANMNANCSRRSKEKRAITYN